ncbi:hypothetical protein ABR737_00105 [Streptomyces sp. Edi2]|uniref:hypothetical protein n=1 Tax=Streptomyces sp. Edi2 TaxID=3162528 RepID=UPI00330616A1
MMTNIESLAPASAVGEILTAAIYNIADQGIPGHDLEAVKARFTDNLPAIVRAAKAYNASIQTGKTEQGAKRDAAIAVVGNYRIQHKL